MEQEDPNDEPYDPWPFVPEMIEIPSIFQSLELDGPFEKCLLCHTPLLGGSQGYMIERMFRGEEPIVEYAVCGTCQSEAAGQLSAASTQQMQQIFATVDHEARAEKLRQHRFDQNADAWIDECLLTGKRRSECRGYQVIGMCLSTEIALGQLPFMLSDDAAKQIAAVLSQETRGYMDEFMDHFGMPPEFSADPEWTPVFI